MKRSLPDAPASSPAVSVWESITGCLSFDRLPDRPEPDPPSTKAFWWLLVVFFLIRLIYIRLLPIVPQEAYYWSYAKHPALSYFDHPPMTAWTIALFTAIGGDTPFFVRIGTVIYTTATLAVLFAATRILFGSARLALAAGILSMCTVFIPLSATVATPDPPLLFFWSLILLAMAKLLRTGQARWWYLAGASLGLGMLSKYSAALVVPGIFVWIAWDRDRGRWLLTPHPYLALAMGLVLFSPVILWNARNEWASFAFQSSRRFGEMGTFRPLYFFKLLGSQAALLTPYILLVVLAGWGWAGAHWWRTRDERFGLLFWLAAPVYAVFTAASFRSLVKMNWMAPAYMSSLIAAVAWLTHSPGRVAAHFRKWARPGLALALFLLLVAHILPLTRIVPLGRADTWNGWPELTRKVLETKTEMGPGAFVFSSEYKISSEISFHSPHHEDTCMSEIIGGDGLQYRFWTKPGELVGRNAVFATDNKDVNNTVARLKSYFADVRPEPPLKIVYGGKTFRTFYLYRCYGYLGTGGSSRNVPHSPASDRGPVVLAVSYILLESRVLGGGPEEETAAVPEMKA